MTPKQWFEKVWQQPGESRSNALERLRGATGLQIKTLYSAVLHEWRVTPETAEKIVSVAGSRIKATTLLFAPRRPSANERKGKPSPRGRAARIPRGSDE